MLERRTSAYIFVVAAVLSAVACGDATGPEGSQIVALPRELNVTERAVISRSNTFGFDLIARVAASDTRSNLVLSPLSASMALGMTLNGADGTTFEAIRSALGFEGLTRDEINDTYRGLIDLLTGLDPQVRFDIANAIWANEGVPFRDAFFQVVEAAFDARAESRDFDDPATLDAINAWVDESTDGLIDRIVDELDVNLVMLLANAIYFDGAWTIRFDPDRTRKQTFAREDESTVEVDMMSLEDVELPVRRGADYSAVELPYGGEAFSMVVVVPSGGGRARDLLRALDDPAWDALIDGLTPDELDLLAIPKFTMSYDAFLNDALTAMGMGEAFRPGADFTRMSPLGDQLCIDYVRQKTYVDVDERGTRAAAATAVGIGTVSFNGLIADRPFIFAIRDRLSGTILFVGLVGDPTFEDPGAGPVVSSCM